MQEGSPSSPRILLHFFDAYAYGMEILFENFPGVFGAGPIAACDDIVLSRCFELLARQCRRQRLIGMSVCHMRKPPTKALSLLPRRAPGGSVFSFFELPPPSTT